MSINSFSGFPGMFLCVLLRAVFRRVYVVRAQRRRQRQIGAAGGVYKDSRTQGRLQAGRNFCRGFPNRFQMRFFVVSTVTFFMFTVSYGAGQNFHRRYWSHNNRHFLASEYPQQHYWIWLFLNLEFLGWNLGFCFLRKLTTKVFSIAVDTTSFYLLGVFYIFNIRPIFY